MGFSLILYLLFIAQIASGQLLSNPAFIASLKAPTSGGGGGGGGGALIFTETFNATGYDNSWSETGSGINEDYTISVPEGAQQLNLTNTMGIAYTTISIAQRATNWCKFIWTPWLNLGTMYFTLATLGSADRGKLFIHSGLNTFKLQHGSAVSGETLTPVMGTTYYVWLEYVNDEDGGAANGSMRAWIRTSPTWPGGTPDLTITTGDATTRPNGLGFLVLNNEAMWVDAFSLYDSTPGSPGF